MTINSQTVWYTGNNETFDHFSTYHVGSGNDQLGPGLYFTTSRETASTYGDIIYGCKIDWQMILDPYSDVNRELLDYLLDQINWDEEWDWESSQQARKAFARMTNLQMVSQMVTSFNYYRDRDWLILRHLSELGYTGFVVGAGSTINQEREDEEKWAIIWDVDSLRIVERSRRQEKMNERKVIAEELTKTEVRDIVKDEAIKVLKSELKKMVEEELKKLLKNRDIKNDIGDISKDILKKLYKDLSIHHTYVIDRVNL